MRIKYCNAGGSGNPPFLISALWSIGILFHKQATRTRHFDGECTFKQFLRKEIKTYIEKFNYCGMAASLALRSLVRSLGQINNSGSGLA
jgi:hypothetical protein